jgi:hypothetical protein
VWRWFLPADPAGPVAFLLNGGAVSLLLAAGLLWILAALAGGATTLSRPEGALIAALVGVGGVAMRSESLERLLWYKDVTIGELYLRMILEVFLFGLALCLAEAVARLVRAGVGKRHPKLLWRDPLDDLTDEQRKGVSLPVTCRKESSGADEGGRWIRLKPAGGCFATAVGAAVVLLFFLAQSNQRGQILFALFASFCLAVMLAQHLFPIACSALAWSVPMVTAVLVYGLAIVSGGGDRPVFQALPIDWLTAGGAGALVGYWVSGLMREARIHEKLLETERQ